VLLAYASYYNGTRTHWSLDKDAPVRRPVQRTGRLRPALLFGTHRPLFARLAIMRQVAETERARAKEESQLDAGYRAALAIRSTIQFCAASMSGNIGR
jgi:hypothetical protein